MTDTQLAVANGILTLASKPLGVRWPIPDNIQEQNKHAFDLANELGEIHEEHQRLPDGHILLPDGQIFADVVDEAFKLAGRWHNRACAHGAALDEAEDQRDQRMMNLFMLGS